MLCFAPQSVPATENILLSMISKFFLKNTCLRTGRHFFDSNTTRSINELKQGTSLSIPLSTRFCLYFCFFQLLIHTLQSEFDCNSLSVLLFQISFAKAEAAAWREDARSSSKCFIDSSPASRWPSNLGTHINQMSGRRKSEITNVVLNLFDYRTRDEISDANRSSLDSRSLNRICNLELLDKTSWYQPFCKPLTLQTSFNSSLSRFFKLDSCSAKNASNLTCLSMYVKSPGIAYDVGVLTFLYGYLT